MTFFINFLRSLALILTKSRDACSAADMDSLSLFLFLFFFFFFFFEKEKNHRQVFYCYLLYKLLDIIHYFLV